ncbi:hypothetical protein GSY71_01220 [Pusillimonas sp. TS35]|nr:hypothetical protein [Pusillimonas sp. TS35]
MTIRTITVPTVTILEEQHDAFELLRQKANQLDALTTLCASGIDSLDGSYHEYALAGIADMAFQVRQLAEAINNSQPKEAA